MPVEAPCVGVGPLVAHDVDKDPVAAFLMKAIDRRIEDLVVIHVKNALEASALENPTACSPLTDHALKRFMRKLGQGDRFCHRELCKRFARATQAR